MEGGKEIDVLPLGSLPEGAGERSEPEGVNSSFQPSLCKGRESALSLSPPCVREGAERREVSERSEAGGL